MDPVATVASIFEIIVSVKNSLHQVQENKELCTHLANRLVSFQIILNDVNLRSHDRFDSLVSSLEFLVEEAQTLINSFCRSRRGPRNVVDALNRVGRFLLRAANGNADRQRFVQVDQRLSVLRDDFEAISSIVRRNENPLSVAQSMFETVVQSMKNDLVREINKVRDEVARGEAMPNDIERLLEAPHEVQQAIDALARELRYEDRSVPQIDTPQMKQYVKANVETIISLSQMPRSAGHSLPVFPSEEEDISGSFDFREEDRLGQAGSYGVTFQATYRPDGKTYALKRVNVRQSRLSEEAIQREAESLKQLCHSNIVRCFYSFFDDDYAFFNVVMELVLGTTLTAYVRSPRPPSGQVMLKWLRQLTSALVYMHGDCRLVHRDLKPDNIMITQDTEDVKIIDFGLARNVVLQGRAGTAQMGRMTAGVGTPLYMSYEKIEGLSYDGRDDVWAVGCIFLELILQQELRLVRLAKDDAQRRLKLQAVMHADPVLGAVVCRILEHQLQERRPSSMELLMLLEDVDVTAAPPPALVDSSLEESVPDPSASGSTDSACISGVTSATPLQSLSMVETVGLLVHLGCRADLGQRVTVLGEMIDGTRLQNMCTSPESDQLTILRELEGNNYSQLRQPLLQCTLRLLKTCHENGVPKDVMAKIQPPAVVVDSISLRGTGGEAPSSGPNIVRTVQPNAELATSVEEISTDTSRPPFTNVSLRSAVELWFSDQQMAETEYGPIGEWNLTGVTDTSKLFKDRRTFNADISRWNVSNVTNMSFMFWNASTFNQPLGSWNVSNVTNMNCMFQGASSFNQPLSSWNVRNVNDMSCLFYGASSFNQTLDSWAVNSVTTMSGMFAGASSFNQPLDSWSVSSVKNMFCMFSGASSFNQPLDSWNVSNVADMSYMFRGSSSFNQPLDSWNVSSVADMSYMFLGSVSFNQPLDSWNMNNVRVMSHMFDGAWSFNRGRLTWFKG